MERRFGDWKNQNEEARMESEIDFEEKMVLIELLAERIRTYRALANLQKKLTDRWEVKFFEQELRELRQEIETWL